MMAGPAFGGTVYVPVITSLGENGVPYETRISISNAGGEPAEFTATFLDVDSDGTTRADEGQTILIKAGSTFQITPEPGFVGLLEVTGDDDLIYDARLVGMLGNHETLGEQVPVISSANTASANTRAYLQGWMRDPDHIANFGIVNLGRESTFCSVDLRRKGGAPLVKDVLVPVKPLSHLHLGDDVLGLLGEFEDVRASVKCEQPFYTYAATFRDSGEVAVIRHSALGTSSLKIPGEDRECPEGSVCFREDGVFHSPRPGNLVRRLFTTPPPGNYRRVFISLEFIHGGWAPGQTSATHNIFWVVRDGNNDMIGYLNAQGPSKDEIFYRHGFDIPQQQKPKIPVKVVLNPGESYRVEYTYDPGLRFIELVLYNQGGQVIARIQTVPNIRTLSISNSNKIMWDFGFDGSHPGEPATFGWGYKDLFVEFVPE
jgi:hypothetical protein